MTSLQERQQRVASGSRRKRDLEAVEPKFDYRAYGEKHFPNESRYAVVAATYRILKQQGDQGYPDPAKVLARMEERGWTNAQRGLA